MVDILCEARAKVLVTIGPGPGGELWQKMAAVVGAGADARDSPAGRPRAVPGARLRTRGTVPRPSTPDAPCSILTRHATREPGDRLVSGRGIRATDIASYFHTGGTTGTPKIARHTHANEVFMSWGLREFFGLGPGSAFLCGLPLFHVNGAIGTGLGVFCSGATVVLAGLQGYRTPGLIAGFWRLVERHRVNYFSAVPTIYAALLDVPIAGADVSSLRYAICGAAPMPPAVIHRFEQLTGLKLLEGYGLTEATCATCVNPPAGERRAGSIGLPMPYQKVTGGDRRVRRPLRA